MKHYRNLALKIFEQGYEPFPLRKKSKSPGIKEPWNSVAIDKDSITAWSANGHGEGGIGIRNCSCIDVDISDKEVAKKIASIISDTIDGGTILRRFGQAPKFCVPLNGSWGKKSKNEWVDKDGNKQAIEYLNSGDQYWVSHATHPDTDKDYRWVGGDIVDISKDSLPCIDVYLQAQLDDALDEIAEELGWTRGGVSNPDKLAPRDTDDEFANLKTPSGTTVEELQLVLDKLPSWFVDDRDQWVKVGAALHFETSGSDAGYLLFDKWSMTSSKYVGSADTAARWRSYKDDKGGSNVTIGSLIHHAKENPLAQKESSESYDDKISELSDTAGISALFTEIAKDKTVGQVWRKDLAVKLKSKADEVIGKGAFTLNEVKKAIAPKVVIKDEAQRDIPEWAKNWVFLAHQNCFTKIRKPGYIVRSGFNGVYNRKLRVMGEQAEADRYVLDNGIVPAVYEAIYLPGGDDFFMYDGHRVVNSYDPSTELEPRFRWDWTNEEEGLVNCMLNHINAMFSPDDARILLDFMTFVVKYPERRVLWMPILHGSEGDGKTVICSMIAAMVGLVNSTIVNAAEIVDSAFNGWAAGDRFKLVEELKISGKNRYVSVNKLKPSITNERVSIHPKGHKSYTAPNTASYMATTNYLDAVPLDDKSRRFALLVSRYRSRVEPMRLFGNDFFGMLHKATIIAPAAFKGMLLERGISDSFNPYDAPRTSGNDMMIESETPDYVTAIKDVIDEGVTVGVNDKCICVSRLKSAVELKGVDEIYPKQLVKVLTNLGYRKYARLKVDGVVEVFWTADDYDYTTENSLIVKDLAFNPVENLF